MFKVNDVVLVFLLYGTYFTPFSSFVIVDFEQVNVNWVVYGLLLNNIQINY